MASVPRVATVDDSDFYPTGDGRPMAETPQHRDNMFALIRPLQRFFGADPTVYVSGNMLLFYERGNKRRHVAPDVFVALGVGNHDRKNYLVWQEGKGPDFVVELTSRSTRKEDLETKFALYRDVLRVREYVLFDPFDEYLRPALRGFRLEAGQYVPIEPVNGRLHSEVLGLYLERQGKFLRLYDPTTGQWLPTPDETEAALEQTEAALERSEAERLSLAREMDQLRRELEVLRARPSGEA